MNAPTMEFSYKLKQELSLDFHYAKLDLQPLLDAAGIEIPDGMEVAISIRQGDAKVEVTALAKEIST